MAVIAVLVAVAIPTFGGQLEKSRQAVDVSNLRDAYAQAKLALLNENDADSLLRQSSVNTVGVLPLKTADSFPTANTYYRFWYKDETLSKVTAADSGAEKAVVGKAATASLRVDTTQLPKEITYVNQTLAKFTGEDATDVAGTTTKGIVVEFLYNVTTNTFSLNNVTFVYQAVAASATAPIATGTGANGISVDADTVSLEYTTEEAWSPTSVTPAVSAESVLTANTDYTLTVAENTYGITATDSAITLGSPTLTATAQTGTVLVTITGKGDYTGQTLVVTLNVSIKKTNS